VVMMAMVKVHRNATLRRLGWKMLLQVPSGLPPLRLDVRGRAHCCFPAPLAVAVHALRLRKCRHATPPWCALCR
jgi:hypothetical protein